MACFFISAFFSAFSNTFWAVLSVRRPPLSLSKTYSSLVRPAIIFLKSFTSFSDSILILSLLPLACLIWIVSSLRLRSPTFSFTVSLTRIPEE